MRGILLLLPAFLLLAGCSSEWKEDVRFKVREIGEISSGPLVVLDVDGEAPEGIHGRISTGSAKPDQFPADIKAGDLVVCQVRQYDDNGFDGKDPKTTVGPCRRA